MTHPLQPDGIFVKLMMLTTSPHDAEALVALRKANRILSEAKVNWAELLGAARQADDFRVPPSKRKSGQRRARDDEWEGCRRSA